MHRFAMRSRERLPRAVRSTNRLVVLLLVALPMVAPARARGRQLPETDRIRLAAFEHLITVLVRADTTVSHAYCVSIRDDSLFEGPPEGSGDDPPAALMSRMRDIVPGIVPASMCPEPVEIDNRSVTPDPITFSVGRPVQTGSVMTVPVSYQTGRPAGGGWTCAVGLRRGSWTIGECLPTWIS